MFSIGTRHISVYAQLNLDNTIQMMIEGNKPKLSYFIKNVDKEDANKHRGDKNAITVFLVFF